ncbi:hypothetical protein BC827DRAFT_1158189 [Russula dissimulans]|nr:hypothetical protein BC827DRAFT_1158189 [Russula dissimulans]
MPTHQNLVSSHTLALEQTDDSGRAYLLPVAFRCGSRVGFYRNENSSKCAEHPVECKAQVHTHARFDSNRDACDMSGTLRTPGGQLDRAPDCIPSLVFYFIMPSPQQQFPTNATRPRRENDALLVNVPVRSLVPNAPGACVHREVTSDSDLVIEDVSRSLHHAGRIMQENSGLWHVMEWNQAQYGSVWESQATGPECVYFRKRFFSDFN